MNLSLPKLPYRDKIQQIVQTQFGGYDHIVGARDGMIFDMENMGSNDIPVLSPRLPRYLHSTLTKPNGIFGNDGLFTVDGTSLKLDGTAVGSVTDTMKTFAALGKVTVIFPDKVFYNALTGVFGSLEASTGSIYVKLENGTYGGEAADANTIEYIGSSSSFNFSTYFKPGDAVTISGAVTHPENNQTIIVREVEAKKLHFYEYSFIISEGGDTETITLSRTVPDMDFICENDNRLWGCKGDTIYASKLGDATNWNVYDGLSTDSYAVDVGTPGDFTGCASYLGYPVFFKDAHIYKIYGDKPSNFEVVKSATMGVADGSSRSFGIAGETLFYLSRNGIVAYSGGVPSSVAHSFGDVKYKNAVGGSDGRKYFVSMQDESGDWTLFQYDTKFSVWIKEDDLHAIGTAWNDDLYILASDGKIWLTGDAKNTQGTTAEQTVESFSVFADFVSASTNNSPSPNKKHTSKVLIRYEVEENSTFYVQMQFDAETDWTTVYTDTNIEKKRSNYLPIIPRRCDRFRIKIGGTGTWRVYSLTREVALGSQNNL